MVREVKFGKSAQQELLKGIEIAYNAVTTTLGAFGRNVLLHKDDGSIHLTKDGVTVASHIRNLGSPLQDDGARLLKMGAKAVVDSAGDGTSTYTLLTYHLIKNAFESIKDDTNVVQMKVGIEKACKLLVDKMKEMSTKVDADNFDDMILNVARISSNGDEELSRIILEAIKSAGREGVVACLKSSYTGVRLDVTSGLKFDSGYASEAFINNPKNLTAELERPLIVVTDKVLSSRESVVPMLEYALVNNRDLLIIAKEVVGQAMGTIITNHQRGIRKFCVVEHPPMYDKQKSLLGDISIVTGSDFINSDSGRDFATHFEESWFGEAEKVIVSRNSTTIVSPDDTHNEQAVINRINLIKNEIKIATSTQEINYLQGRLAKLVGGIYTILVGGENQVEAMERLDRADDAKLACISAIEEGVIVGGGASIFRAGKSINFEDSSIFINRHQLMGAKVVQSVISEPIIKILQNAGFNMQDIYQILHELTIADDQDSTYNLLSDSIDNGYKSGIIDSMKVARVSLENAVSVAGNILTTNCVIYDVKEAGDDERLMTLLQNFNQE